VEALEVDPDAVGVQPQSFGEFLGAGRAAQLAEQFEQACTRRLDERGVQGLGGVHERQELLEAGL
jgi:hypothetical protein